MNYPEELREKWNECMYDERDIIQKFLEKQYDLRYGRQRDSWHFEPAIELLGNQGQYVRVSDVRLDKDRFVVFRASCDGDVSHGDWECFDFAYGELSKIIEALPDADDIRYSNAVSDLERQHLDLRLDFLLKESPFEYKLNKNVIRFDGFDGAIDFVAEHLSKQYGTDFVVKLRDHINIEHLHRTKEYKEVMKWLALEPNLCKSVDEYARTNYGSVVFTLAGTDIEFDMSEIQRDDKGNLTIFGADTCCEDELITLTEKDIRREYLAEILKWLTTRGDIMDTYNSHNAELVRKINTAWKSGRYNQEFGYIVYSIALRDYNECEEKFDCNMGNFLSSIIDDCNEGSIHNVLEHVCDDWDLETILSFIRYEE